MPGLTVEELWRQVMPPGTELAAGAVGLDREVTWPATMRTRAPAFPHLKGGEIALISTEAMRLLDPRPQLTSVLRSLAGLSVSAVAVSGTVPTDARDLANSIGLPVLLVPAGSPLAELEHSIARAIVDRRTELHQRSQEIYRRLTELAIEGRGVDAILELLAELTGRDIVLEGGDFTTRACVTRSAAGCDAATIGRFRQDADRIASWLSRAALSASEPPTLRLAVGEAMARVVAPIVIRDVILGYLSVLGPRGALSDLDDLAASRGASACAIDLARERAVSEAEDRLQSDLVDALVTGSFGSLDGILSRGERLGFDLKQPHDAFVFTAEIVREDGRSTSVPVHLLRAALEREAADRSVRGPIGHRGDRAVLLAPAVGDAAAARSQGEELRQALARAVDATVSCGVGRVHAGVDGLRLAYQEGDGALTLGQRVLGRGQTAHFGDLGLYRLLLGLRSTTELESFYVETLGALSEYDRRNDGELVKTLDAYLACLGSPTEAAERLHVHRNTLLYRLRRIQEVAAVNLNDAETRLALHLALRVRDVLDADMTTGRAAQTAGR